ncbi:hypothetical protein D3C76_1077180 [compost metagenome]
MEVHALINGELDLMVAVGQQQSAMSIDVLNKSRDRVNIDGVRQVSRQAHNNGDVGVVAFTRQGQGAIYIYNHACNVVQNAA